MPAPAGSSRPGFLIAYSLGTDSSGTDSLGNDSGLRAIPDGADGETATAFPAPRATVIPIPAARRMPVVTAIVIVPPMFALISAPAVVVPFPFHLNQV